jgi:DNA-binding transcriptional LysR family regulator
MLELRRLRLLRELHERGTIAAVADALQFTPSAVSQQLNLLERETGVQLLEKAGRGVRLTDPALVLVEHAEALLQRAARAEADLAAATNTISGRARIAAFPSVAIKLAIPAIERLQDTALRCELVEAEPEQALPALALGDLDLVLGDEWQHQPWRIPSTLVRHHLFDDPVLLVGSDDPLPTLSNHVWTSGQPGMAWDEMLQRTCREHGGFAPDVRHRTNDANVSLALVRAQLAVTLLPQLAIPPGFTTTPVPVKRAILAVTRATDAHRPSINALLDALQAA